MSVPPVDPLLTPERLAGAALARGGSAAADAPPPWELTPYGDRLYERTRYLSPEDPAYQWAHALLCDAIAGPMYEAIEVADPVEPWAPFQNMLNVEACPPWALDWLGGVVGVRVDPRMSTADKRATIAAVAGFHRGTRQAIAYAIQLYLTGKRTVYFRERDPSGADPPYTLEVVTNTYEMPPSDRFVQTNRITNGSFENGVLAPWVPRVGAVDTPTAGTVAEGGATHGKLAANYRRSGMANAASQPIFHGLRYVVDFAALGGDVNRWAGAEYLLRLNLTLRGAQPFDGDYQNQFDVQARYTYGSPEVNGELGDTTGGWEEGDTAWPVEVRGKLLPVVAGKAPAKLTITIGQSVGQNGAAYTTDFAIDEATLLFSTEADLDQPPPFFEGALPQTTLVRDALRAAKPGGLVLIFRTVEGLDYQQQTVEADARADTYAALPPHYPTYYALTRNERI